MQAGDKGDYEQCQYSISEPVDGRGVTEAETVLLLCLAVDPRDDVLRHSERTDHRTIDSAEKKGQYKQHRHYSEIQGQEGRKELYLRHPSEPCVDRSCEIQEEKRHAYKEDGRQDDSNFS